MRFPSAAIQVIAAGLSMNTPRACASLRAPGGELIMQIQGGTDSIFALLAARQSGAAAGPRSAAYADAAKASTASETPAAGAESPPLDFTHMTPSEMQGVAKKLFDAGEIDLTQLFMLQNAGVPLGKLGASGEFVSLSEDEQNVFRNEPVNYFQVAQGAMEFIEYSGKTNDPTSGYANWKGLVEALQRATGGVDLLG